MQSYRLLAALALTALAHLALAQRGKIIQTASSSVMDPNGDGFVSKTTDGFSNKGYYVDEFEIEMFPLPIFGDGDTLNDTQAGPNCGTTDLTVDSTGVSAYAALDADNNLIFRLRLADEHPSVEAYSILIDTDGAIGDADPNSTGNNAGFEIDITLIKSKSKGVEVYNIDGIDSCPTALLQYDLDDNFQISIADEVSCGDEDYFYDFFVPFGDLETEFGITVDSELQFVVLTNISGTCAMAGKISDIGGVDDNEYGGCITCAFDDLASNQCPVPFSSILEGGEGFLSGATPTPTMELPLKSGDAVITGTAEPTAELILDVYDLNDNFLGTETAIADADSIWTITLGTPLVQGDSVTVVAQLEGVCDSGVTGSQISFAVVVLNTTPQINGTGTVLNYTENDGEVQVDPGVIASDAEDLDLVSATVQIITGFEPAEDALTFTDQLGITGSYDAGTAKWTLTGDATIDDYNTALQSVSYVNSSEDPVVSTRTVEFAINDGTEDSAPFTRNISVSSVNDAPVINGTSGSTEYTDQTPPFVVNNTFSITDADDSQISSATVQIFESSTNSYVDGDDLFFTNMLGITGTFNNTTGVLSLSGTTTLTNYATAINSVEYEYNPPGSANENTRRVEFIVSDGTDNSAIFNHFITFATSTNFPPDVVDENGDPVVDGINVVTNEDSTVEVCLTVNDPDGDLVAIDNITAPVNGSIVETSDLCFEYTPDDNYTGTETVTVTVCDGFGNCDNTPVDIDIVVDEVNDAPVLAASTATVDEKITTKLCIDPADITDIESDTHVFSVGTSANGGTVSDGTVGDLCFNYTPPSNFVGADQIEVTICDDDDPLVCATNTIDVDVVSVNENPIIFVNGIESSTMTVEMFEDTARVFCFAVVDVDGDNVSTTSITRLSGNGTLVEEATEFCYEYTPTADDNGTSVWEIIIEDDAAAPLSDMVVVTLNIAAVNDPPTLDAIADPAAIDEDASQQMLNLAGISPGGGETQTLMITATSDNPGLIPNPTIVYTSADPTGSLAFTPLADQSGTATITVTVDDAQSSNNTVQQTFTITVNPVNDPPTLDAIASPGAISEDAVEQIINLAGISAGGGETQTLILSATSDNPALIPDPMITYVNGNPTGSLAFTPLADQSGTANITVTINDGQATNNIKQEVFTIQVDPVNDPPTLDAIVDPAAIDEDASEQTINFVGVSAGGGEIQTLTVTATSDNTNLVPNPTVTYTSSNPTGSLAYTPASDQFGTATITVSVDDGESVNNTIQQTFTVTVNGINDPPTIVTSTIDVDEKATSQICLSASDIENNEHIFSSGNSLTASGSISDAISGDLCFDYTPPDGFLGADQVEVTICDQADPTVCSNKVITVNVLDVNETPIIIVNGLEVTEVILVGTEDTPLDLCISVNDPDGDNTSTQSITNVNGGGQLVENTAFCYSFTPDQDINGIVTWELQICDDNVNQLCRTVPIEINLQAVNDPPVVDMALTSVDEKITSSICVNATDVELDSHQFISGTSLLANAIITDEQVGDMCFEYTPPVNFIGTDQVELTICDVDDPTVCTTEVINVEVLDVNDAPIILLNGLEVNNISLNGLEDTVLDFCLEFTDPEGNNVFTSSLSNLEGGGNLTDDSDALCYSYAPEENVNGLVTWEVEVCDDGVPSKCTTVFIEIDLENVNDAPVAQVDTLRVLRREPGSINVLLNDSDIDGDELFLGNLVESPIGGEVVLSSDATITYTSSVTFRGIDQLTYTIQDSGTPMEVATAQLVIVVGDNPFTIYQTISPNGDGINDYWHIEGIDFYPTNEVKLFDRFNNLVFQVNGYDNRDKRWEGRRNQGSGGILEDGTYYYQVLAGDEGEFTGFVVLRTE